MQRVAFQLRIREGMIEAYEEAHRNVWPEMLDELRAFGIEEYSIFRRGQQLFLYMHVDDFQQTLARMEASEVNARWQQAMAPLFEAVPGLEADESFAMMKEVFYMRGGPPDADASADGLEDSRPAGGRPNGNETATMTNHNGSQKATTGEDLSRERFL